MCHGDGNEHVQSSPHRFAARGLVEQREHMLVRSQFLSLAYHDDANRRPNAAAHRARGCAQCPIRRSR